MGIADTKHQLAANRMIFDVRRDPALYTNFADNFETVMENYGLSEDERQAFRDIDIKRLGELGVHPYFLPQVSRLFHGGAYNHNNSPSAQASAKASSTEKGKPDNGKACFRHRAEPRAGHDRLARPRHTGRTKITDRRLQCARREAARNET